jgi:CHAT domain-containing protein/tetratricopeptide (TPR) repeat protein
MRTLGILILLASAAAANGDEWLQPPAQLERTLDRCGEHTYRLRLNAGESLRGFAEQDASDVVVSVTREPGDVAVVSVDDFTDGGGRERFVIVAEEASEYRLRIHTKPLNEDGGLYRLEVAPIAPASDRDRLEAAAKVLIWIGRTGVSDRREAFESAIALCRSAEAVACEATALKFRAHLNWHESRDLREGRDLLHASAVLLRESDDRWAEGEVLNDLGIFNGHIGELVEAREAFERAIPLRRTERGDDPLVLHNAAPVYWQLGELQRAIDLDRRALELWRAGKHWNGVALALTVLGKFALILGDTAGALRDQTEALRLWKLSGHHYGVVTSTSRIAAALEAEGKWDDAERKFAESVELSRKIGDARGESEALLGMGRVLNSSRRHDAARKTFEAALQILRRANLNESAALKGLGDSAASTGEPERALEWYGQAIDIQTSNGDQAGLAETMLAMAHVERNRGRLHEARTILDRATATIESLRLRVASADLRASYLASRQRYFDLTIDVLMSLYQRTGRAEFSAAALEASERARARGIRDWLELGGIGGTVDPALAAREETVRHQINGKAAVLTGLPRSERNEVARAALSKELDSLFADYRDLRGQIARAGGEGAPALDVTKIQRLLDADTILLEYALGEERSFVWVVTPGAVKSFVLPGRNTINGLARRTTDLFSKTYKREVVTQALLHGTRLSAMILGAVAPLLRSRRLVIVGDGALQFVSFAALPDPRSPDQPLIARHEIVVLPSASLIEAIRARSRSRPSPSGTIAILADPVFHVDDPRLKGQTGAQSIPADLLRSASGFGIKRFERLPYTREEANQIAALIPEAQRLEALDFGASRETALSGALSEYRVVHFATHGLINAQYPELTGLVLSLVRPDGTSQDGFLRLNDIYTLRLKADLVVMSACRTAVGKEIPREGLVGLTRAFMFAGVPRIVASIWDVRDAATAELMRRFYTRMMTDGLTPAAALRAAQLSMWREPRWSAPFYWGALVLQGEWR